MVIDPMNTWGQTAHLYACEGTSVINGHITLKSGAANIGVYGGWNRHVVLTGGVSGNGYFYYRGRADDYGMSQLIVTNTPCDLAAPFRAAPWPLNSRNRGAHVILAVAGNRFLSIGENHTSTFWNCADLSTTVDDAITSDTSVYIGNCTTWDLCGTKQHVGLFEMCFTGNTPAIVTNSSEQVATLQFSQTEDWVNKGVFAGNVNVVIGGTKKLTIESAMQSTGSVTVNGATLAFTADGSWATATALTVTGSGKVTIAKSGTLGKKATLTLASASSIELGSGVEQRVGKLTIGEKEYTTGDFTFGNGTLHVGAPGMVITVR